MAPVPVVSAHQLITVLEKSGFVAVPQRGSHVRLRHLLGCLVTVRVHPGQYIGRGLLNKILRDADLSREAFIELLK